MKQECNKDEGVFGAVLGLLAGAAATWIYLKSKTQAASTRSAKAVKMQPVVLPAAIRRSLTSSPRAGASLEDFKKIRMES